MVFDRVIGQEPAVESLKRALSGGRLHHAYLFDGPEGVGKERTAFAFAQSLVCTSGDAIGCGVCSACERAGKLSETDPRVPLHPDVLLVARGLYPPGVLGETSREITAIGVPQIRKIVLGRTAYPPHEAKHLVVIIRAADELSTSAANALLKTLEEPPRPVHFVLLTSRPLELLDTVRSRALRIRFGPLPDEAVAEILRQHQREPTLAAFAQGSASLALELSEPEVVAEREAFLSGALRAINALDASAALDFARDRGKDRQILKPNLERFAQQLAWQGRETIATARAASPAQQALEPLELARELAEGYSLVARALEALDLNAQPTLVVEAMLIALRRLALVRRVAGSQLPLALRASTPSSPAAPTQ